MIRISLGLNGMCLAIAQKLIHTKRKYFIEFFFFFQFACYLAIKWSAYMFLLCKCYLKIHWFVFKKIFMLLENKMKCLCYIYNVVSIIWRSREKASLTLIISMTLNSKIGSKIVYVGVMWQMCQKNYIVLHADLML